MSSMYGNAIAFHANVNEAGESLIDTAKRSFDHSPSLFNRTFQSFVVRPTEKNNWEPIGLIYQRVHAVMTAVAQALHYRDQRQKWGRWRVFVPSLRSESSLVHKISDGWDSLGDLPEPCALCRQIHRGTRSFQVRKPCAGLGLGYTGSSFIVGLSSMRSCSAKTLSAHNRVVIESGKTGHRPTK